MPGSTSNCGTCRDMRGAACRFRYIYIISIFVYIISRFGGMTSVYYKYSHGAIVTFDLARRETFLAGLAWLADYTAAMELEGEEAAPVVMVGNKSDCDTGDQVSVGCMRSG